MLNNFYNKLFWLFDISNNITKNKFCTLVIDFDFILLQTTLTVFNAVFKFLNISILNQNKYNTIKYKVNSPKLLN